MEPIEYEDVCLRLPKGLKEAVLAEGGALSDVFEREPMTLSEITAVALRNWILA